MAMIKALAIFLLTTGIIAITGGLLGHAYSVAQVKSKTKTVNALASNSIIADDKLARDEQILLAERLEIDLSTYNSDELHRQKLQFVARTEFMPWSTGYRYMVNERMMAVSPELVKAYIANPPIPTPDLADNMANVLIEGPELDNGLDGSSDL